MTLTTCITIIIIIQDDPLENCNETNKHKMRYYELSLS